MIEKDENLRKGRDKLMFLLLQFITGSIKNSATQDFVDVLQLYCMYSDTLPLPVPSTGMYYNCTRVYFDK